MNDSSWNLLSPDARAQEQLSAELGILPVTAGLLLNRGLSGPRECGEYLSPSIDDLHDPFLMRDMRRGADVILSALSAGKKIFVYGDFDADGITSTAILTRVLRDNGADVCFYIPHRISEGYGLNEQAVEYAHRQNAGLIITVDCGITSIKEVSRARALGIDTVITDHHEPVTLALPPADAIIDPKQSCCSYPYKMLAGAGIAFKLSWALFGKDAAMEHIDLAAMGSVADVVPLTGENRIIVKCGLAALSEAKKPGIASLIKKAGIKKTELTVQDVAFMLGPRLNAPGRIDSAKASVELLMTDDTAEAESLAAKLEENNRERQKMQKVIYDSAMGMLDSGEPDPLIALSADSWHPGLIGIIASKISEHYSRPAVLISSDPKNSRGSARSGGDFHILSALNQCRGLLSDLGGHARAAGFSIKQKNIPEFLTKIKNIGAGSERPGGSEAIDVDAVVTLGDVTEELISEIARLHPCGEGNPEPLFMAEDVNFSAVRCLKNKHLKASASQGGFAFDLIGFGMYDSKITQNTAWDILFVPGINVWNLRKSIQLVLKGISPDEKR